MSDDKPIDLPEEENSTVTSEDGQSGNSPPADSGKPASTMPIYIFIMLVFFIINASVFLLYRYRADTGPPPAIAVEKYYSVDDTVEVVFTDSPYFVFDKNSDTWKENHEKKTPTNSLILTGKESRRNIFVFEGIRTLRTDADTCFIIKRMKSADVGDQFWQVKVIYGDVWLECGKDVMRIETPQGTAVPREGTLQISAGKNNDVKIYSWRGTTSFIPMGKREKEAEKVFTGQYLEVLADDPTVSINDFREEKTSWQIWNEECSAKDSRNGYIAAFPEEKAEEPVVISLPSPTYTDTPSSSEPTVDEELPEDPSPAPNDTKTNPAPIEPVGEDGQPAPPPPEVDIIPPAAPMTQPTGTIPQQNGKARQDSANIYDNKNTGSWNDPDRFSPFRGSSSKSVPMNDDFSGGFNDISNSGRVGKIDSLTDPNRQGKKMDPIESRTNWDENNEYLKRIGH